MSSNPIILHGKVVIGQTAHNAWLLVRMTGAKIMRRIIAVRWTNGLWPTLRIALVMFTKQTFLCSTNWLKHSLWVICTMSRSCRPQPLIVYHGSQAPLIHLKAARSTAPTSTWAAPRWTTVIRLAVKGLTQANHFRVCHCDGKRCQNTCRKQVSRGVSTKTRITLVTIH